MKRAARRVIKSKGGYQALTSINSTYYNYTPQTSNSYTEPSTLNRSSIYHYSETTTTTAKDKNVKGEDETQNKETEPSQNEPQQTTEQLKAENAKLKTENAKLITAVAEYDNQRKRAEELKVKEVESAQNFGIQNFAKSLLDVADNLERAQANLPKDQIEGNAVLKSFVEGVDLTQKGLMKAFEKNGLKRLDPMNEKFDPAYHQALFQVDDDTKAPNTVCIVQQVGYTLKGRNLRSAMVGVTKKPPTPK